MEINFHLRSVEAPGACGVKQPRGPESQPAGDETAVAFENTRALMTALENTPAVREELVQRATELIGDVSYPPPETIRMISHLLAIQIHPDGEHS